MPPASVVKGKITSNMLKGALKRIPGVERLKVLIDFRDRLTPYIYQTKLSKGTCIEALEIQDDLNRRLLRIFLKPSNPVDPDKILKRANERLRINHPDIFRELKNILSAKGTEFPGPFQNFNRKFMVAVLPDKAMNMINILISRQKYEIAGLNFEGLPIVDESTLKSAMLGMKDALLYIQHELRHNDYLAMHGYKMTGIEQFLVNELYADFASFVDILGARGLTDKYLLNQDYVTYADIIADELIKNYAGKFSSKSKKERFYLRFYVSVFTLNKLIRFGAADPALAYLKTLTGLDQIIGMQDIQQVKEWIGYFSARLSHKYPGWETHSIKIPGLDQLRDQYEAFCRIYYEINKKNDQPEYRRDP